MEGNTLHPEVERKLDSYQYYKRDSSVLPRSWRLTVNNSLNPNYNWEVVRAKLKVRPEFDEHELLLKSKMCWVFSHNQKAHILYPKTLGLGLLLTFGSMLWYRSEQIKYENNKRYMEGYVDGKQYITKNRVSSKMIHAFLPILEHIEKEKEATRRREQEKEVLNEQMDLIHSTLEVLQKSVDA